jgi:hypothetical protein
MQLGRTYFEVVGVVYNNLMNNPMKRLLATVVLLAVVHATVVPHVGPIDTHVPLTFKVQID